jgi:hypothetical protein
MVSSTAAASLGSNVVSLADVSRQERPQETGLSFGQMRAQPLPADAFFPIARKTADMADQTREEIDAKLAAVEARSETRFVELSGKVDRVLDAVDQANMSYIRSSRELRDEIQAVKSDNKFTRTTIIVTVIASLLAGLAALWVTQSNMLASFQAGISLHDSSAAPPAPPAKATTPAH